MPRTTVDIEAPLLKEIKRLQREEGLPMGKLICRLLADALASRRPTSTDKRKLRWIVREMNPLARKVSPRPTTPKSARERGYVGGIGVQFGYAGIPTSDGGLAVLGVDNFGYLTVFKLDTAGNIGACLSSLSSDTRSLLPQVVNVNVGTRSVSPVPVDDLDGPFPQTVNSTAWCGVSAATH